LNQQGEKEQEGLKSWQLLCFIRGLFAKSTFNARLNPHYSDAVAAELKGFMLFLECIDCVDACGRKPQF
jgi:hypothetical protein